MQYYFAQKDVRHIELMIENESISFKDPYFFNFSQHSIIPAYHGISIYRNLKPQIFAD